jgi:hypothetical protein
VASTAHPTFFYGFKKSKEVNRFLDSASLFDPSTAIGAGFALFILIFVFYPFSLYRRT